jgi:hypothetical protein
VCGCPVVSLAERGLLGYIHWPSQLQGGGSVRPTQLSRLDVAAPYLNCRVRVKVKVRVRVNQDQGEGEGQDQG